jgi:hypothetical protein
MRARTSIISALLVLLVAAAGCDDEQTKNRGGQAQPVGQEPQAQLGRAAPEEQNHATVSIEIQAGDVKPRQLELQAAQPVQLEIINSTTTDCTFFLGGYVTGVAVPAGQTMKQSLTLPQGASSSDEVDMGCQGDTERRGVAVIEFRGTAPGEGR